MRHPGGALRGSLGYPWGRSGSKAPLASEVGAPRPLPRRGLLSQGGQPGRLQVTPGQVWSPPAPAPGPTPSSPGIPSFRPKQVSMMAQRNQTSPSKPHPAHRPSPPGGWPGAPLLRPLPRAPGPGAVQCRELSPGREQESCLWRKPLCSELLVSLTRRSAPSQRRTQLITSNYISFKSKNPLKERTALAAGRCLPTHRGNHGFLCLNYGMLP